MDTISLHKMPRRTFVAVVAGGLLAAPLAAEAQGASGKALVVGLLDFGSPDPGRLGWWQAFRQGL